MKSRLWGFGTAFCAVSAVFSIEAVSAQRGGRPPVVRASSPAWILVGQTTTVTLFGSDLTTETVRFDTPGITGKVMSAGPAVHKSDEEKRRGNTAVTLEVSVPASLKPGHYGLTLVGKNDQQVPASLFVDVSAPEISEKEPNDTLFKPQALPEGSVTVTGKLDNEGVDVYRIEGKKGETWRFELFARRVNASNKLEAVIRLRDGARSPLKAAVDQGCDCSIEYTLPSPGGYTLEIVDGDNRSAGDFIYRLAVRRL